MKRLTFLLIALLVAASCNSQVTGLGPPSDPANETFAPSLGVDVAQMSKTAAGVYYKDLVVGTDTLEIKTSTDSVKVTYAGHLKDGTLFDSGVGVLLQPFALIPGFRDGMLGMREGGKRKLVIPSQLGYAGQSIKNVDGTIKIPRQSTLIFDVDLLKVYNPATPASP